MQNDTEITREQAVNMLGNDAERILKIANLSAFCSNCVPLNRASSAIGMTVDKYLLTKNGDIVLGGRCDKCDKPINRLLETGKK